MGSWGMGGSWAAAQWVCGEEGLGGCGLVAPEGLDDGGLVDGQGDGLADAFVLQLGVLDVEGHVEGDGAGGGVDEEAGGLGEGVDHVEGDYVAREVGGVLFEFEGGGDVVGDDVEAEVLEVWGGVPVGWVAVEEDFFILCLADEAVGAGADGVLAEIFGGVAGDYAEEAVGHVEEEAVVGAFGVDFDGEGVGVAMRSMRAKFPDLLVMREPSVRERRVKATSSASRGGRCGSGRPGRRWKSQVWGSGRCQEVGEPGLEVEVVVLDDEGVEDEGAYSLGLGVGALAEVEVVGGGFEEDGDFVGAGLVGWQPVRVRAKARANADSLRE